MTTEFEALSDWLWVARSKTDARIKYHPNNKRWKYTVWINGFRYGSWASLEAAKADIDRKLANPHSAL